MNLFFKHTALKVIEKECRKLQLIYYQSNGHDHYLYLVNLFQIEELPIYSIIIIYLFLLKPNINSIGSTLSCAYFRKSAHIPSKYFTTQKQSFVMLYRQELANKYSIFSSQFNIKKFIISNRVAIT